MSRRRAVHDAVQRKTMGIYDFKHGVRIPAGSCATYSNTPGARIASLSSSLVVYADHAPLDVSGVCQLPVPEQAIVRQFVMVGNCVKGRIDAYIGAVGWNAPRQHILYAPLAMLPTTPYEIPDRRQKKTVVNVPTSGAGALTIDRINCYFIDVHFRSDEPISLEDDLELFYFEVYWD